MLKRLKEFFLLASQKAMLKTFSNDLNKKINKKTSISANYENLISKSIFEIGEVKHKLSIKMKR
jgi:hypothetical protein